MADNEARGRSTAANYHYVHGTDVGFDKLLLSKSLAPLSLKYLCMYILILREREREKEKEARGPVSYIIIILMISISSTQYVLSVDHT